jgi:leucine-rich PPR motif-containing protein
MVFLPTSVFGTATASAVESILGEVFVLLIFFVTWTVTSRLWAQHNKAKSKGGKWELEGTKKSKPRKDPAEAARLIQDLCKDHFTRALRLYRELVKADQDVDVTSEEFYLALVEGAVRVGKPDVALQILERMKDNGLEPSTGLVQSVFRLLCARRYYGEVVRIAEMFVLKHDPVVTSCLTLAAGELGQLALCEKLLSRQAADEEPSPDSTESKEYLPLMKAYARRKDWGSAERAVRDLMARGVKVENVLFNSVLASGGQEGEPDAMAALLKDMLAHDKNAVDVVSYNTLMKSYARHRQVTKCFGILEEIHASGMEPDDVTFSTLLDVCIDEDEHQLASVALDQLCASGLKMNCVLLTTLMKGFIRSKRLDLAMNLYDSMCAPGSDSAPDMVTYSQLIKAHCDAQNMGRALDILEDMLQCGTKVDDVVFTHLIEGCCHINNVELAEKLFRDMRTSNVRPTIYTLTALIKVYGKCGQSQKAKDMVETMEEKFGVRPTVVVYTCLISGLIRQRKCRAAYGVYQRMAATFPPDAHGCATMAAGLLEVQMWDELCEVVKTWPGGKAPQRFVETLNSALNSLLGRGETMKAKKLYQLMADRKLAVTVPSIQRRLNR